MLRASPVFGRRTSTPYAHGAANSSDAGVTLFDDVVVEALASHSENEARRFVARELGGIDGADRRARVLRDTLRVYFALGLIAAATGKALGIHEQTVAQRLHASRSERVE